MCGDEVDWLSHSALTVAHGTTSIASESSMCGDEVDWLSHSALTVRTEETNDNAALQPSSPELTGCDDEDTGFCFAMAAILQQGGGEPPQSPRISEEDQTEALTMAPSSPTYLQ